jgi:CubicO group peptidase (beta-lactamase class C family)
MPEVHGTCNARFESVRTTFASNLDTGLDVGASVAVFLDGEPVVDLWGGTVDELGTPWAQDTIINVWSTTKTMTALSALVLADRGEIDVDAPVATYWPEFAAAGKDGVLVRHLLSHTAGLPGWEEPMAPEDLYDWEKATSLLAAQAPWWEPGTASGYHAVTQGYLVGEVVRRVAGESVGTFFAKEVAAPLDADFHIGTPAEHDDRVAIVIPPPDLELPPDPDSHAVRALSNPRLKAEQSWEVDWRRAEIPAAGGHGNARSVAAVQSVVACGGEARGVRLLSAEGCETIFREQCNGTDLVLGMPLRHGIGYGLPSPEVPISPSTRACYWGGWGGSIVVVDLDQRLCVAYVMNRMGEGTQGDLRGASLVFAAYASLG